MLDKIFKEIAEQEGGSLQILDQKLELELGTRSPHLVFHLRIPYKDALIYLKNSTGTQFYGIITCVYEVYKPNVEFELSTRSHFSTLFRKNKNRFKLNTSSEAIRAFFKQSKAFQELMDIASNTVFEPAMEGINENLKYKLTTKYSLQFSDWTQSIRPLIRFHKEFVDYIF